MNERSLTVLELPKILERLASHTSFSVGHELAISLRPTVDPYEVNSRIKATTEARRLLELRPSVGLGGARDIRTLVHRAVMGGRLEPDELLSVQGTLQSGRVLHLHVVRLDDQLPVLAAIARQIVDCPDLASEIARCIDDRGEVVTEASPELARIRSTLRGTRERLLQRLTETLNSPSYRPMIQEPIVTQRDGRYVIPVKVEYRGKFRGIVHDQSASGATLFVEPLATVELNNRVRELELAEEREVDRILRALSSKVASYSNELDSNVTALAQLDLALAKAKYANSLRAAEPEVVADPAAFGGEPVLELHNARHPLLSGHVVPISIWLGGAFRVLVLTGPNTGGKTVALKTAGLLALMAQAGLHIPADEGSRTAVFREVFADIGDEQSIEQSLSTFSSHMRNVVKVLKEATARSLVLLDELGAGTDPSEGSALAQAVLDDLLNRGVLTMATTHYSELKAYAHGTPGVENASVEFDVETLTPTYRLSIGLPGRSNAFAIATRLGLSQGIIAKAQEKLQPGKMIVEELLQEIREERDRAIDERLAAEQRRREAERDRAALKARLDDIDREREAVIAEARLEGQDVAAREIARVRGQLSEALGAIEGASGDRLVLLAGMQKAQRAERELEALRHEQVAAPPVALETIVPAKGPLRVGDLVLVSTVNQQGEVLALPVGSAEAEVQVGNFKLRVRRRELRRLGHVKAAAPPQETRPEARSAVPTEIEVRGWRAEEVPPVIDKYVHDAYLAGLPYVRIIHGKGTGVLRRLVREQLAANPLVKAMQHPESRDGGEGVTVVELAN